MSPNTPVRPYENIKTIISRIKAPIKATVKFNLHLQRSLGATVFAWQIQGGHKGTRETMKEGSQKI